MADPTPKFRAWPSKKHSKTSGLGHSTPKNEGVNPPPPKFAGYGFTGLLTFSLQISEDSWFSIFSQRSQYLQHICWRVPKHCDLWDEKRRGKPRNLRELVRKRLPRCGHIPMIGWIEMGVPKGGTAKMCSWTCIRCNGAFRPRDQAFLSLTVETRHVDTYPSRFGHISDTYQWAPALCFGSGFRQQPTLCATPLNQDHFSTPKPQVCWFHFWNLVQKEKSLLGKSDSPY